MCKQQRASLNSQMLVIAPTAGSGVQQTRQEDLVSSCSIREGGLWLPLQRSRMTRQINRDHSSGKLCSNALKVIFLLGTQLIKTNGEW